MHWERRQEKQARCKLQVRTGWKKPKGHMKTSHLKTDIQYEKNRMTKHYNIAGLEQGTRTAPEKQGDGK